MRVLVTGAGDFLGRRLLESLRAALPPGSRILGIDRAEPPALAGVEGARVESFDAGRLAAVVGAFDPTFVFHLAALASVAQSSETPAHAWRADLLGTLNLAEALARTRAGVVFLSSTVVYGAAFRRADPIDEAVTPRPDTISGRTKTACEHILRDVLAGARVKHVVLRPANYIGPGQSETFVVPSLAGQIARIERGVRPPVVEVGDLAAERDFIDVADVTAACLAALDAYAELGDGGVFNVGSGASTPVSAILETLRTLATAPFEVRVAADRLRPAQVASERCDTTAFAAATGWRPRIGLGQSLAAILAHARAGGDGG